MKYVLYYGIMKLLLNLSHTFLNLRNEFETIVNLPELL
jgi:hypothetical protein